MPTVAAPPALAARSGKKNLSKIHIYVSVPTVYREKYRFLIMNKQKDEPLFFRNFFFTSHNFSRYFFHFYHHAIDIMESY